MKKTTYVLLKTTYETFKTTYMFLKVQKIDVEKTTYMLFCQSLAPKSAPQM